MRTRFAKVMAGLAALTALALGGSAIAGAAQPTKPASAPAPAAAEQQGSAKADNDSIQQENGADDATEAAGNEAAEPAEAGESSSETAGDDGPGGHADEPANANADHQFEGKE